MMLPFNLSCQAKKNHLLLTYPYFLLHALPHACCVVAKFLDAYHILGKFANATSYFKILSIIFFTFVCSPHHPHLLFFLKGIG
jgi:hypothetical protein